MRLATSTLHIRRQKKADPIGQNIVQLMCVFAYYSLNTYLRLLKTELWTLTRPLKAIQLLYIEIYFIALKQPSTLDCIAIQFVTGSPSHYLVFLMSFSNIPPPKDLTVLQRSFHWQSSRTIPPHDAPQIDGIESCWNAFSRVEVADYVVPVCASIWNRIDYVFV